MGQALVKKNTRPFICHLPLVVITPTAFTGLDQLTSIKNNWHSTKFQWKKGGQIGSVGICCGLLGFVETFGALKVHWHLSESVGLYRGISGPVPTVTTVTTFTHVTNLTTVTTLTTLTSITRTRTIEKKWWKLQEREREIFDKWIQHII